MDKKQELLNGCPHEVFSGWMTRSNKVLATFHKKIHSAERTEYAPSVQKLADFIEGNPVVKYLVEDACNKNKNLVEACEKGQDNPDYIMIPRIKDTETFLHGFNTILKQAPQFVDNELVGLPYSAWVVGLDPTLSGVALFSLPMFNEVMKEILHEWFLFLDHPESGIELFGKEGEQWLSDKAKAQYQFDDWAKNSETLPYWKSWNSFFTRQFKDKVKQRPIADPESNQTVISPNDGSVFRWQDNVLETDVFWFKDMRYSISDILSSSDKEQQALIDQYDLVNMFKGGTVFQTYLNPYNFHRWWVPVNGEVLFDPIVIPGDYFNKVVIPDFAGATTASLPYSIQVNARGLIVFKTEDYGYVCCLPLGMGEVSTISFDEKMKKSTSVHKGEEMGTFNYGGSSFVMIYQKMPNKKLVFIDAEGNLIPKEPILPEGSASVGGITINIGAQIGKWIDVI